MRISLVATILLALWLPQAPAQAGPIENACLGSGRPAATRALCSCIDTVARQTLSSSEQRQAARFFNDPQRAQDVRMSKTDRDNAFWARYRAFAASAELYCAR